LAITYSGNIYMNLDIKLPDARTKNIIELIKPELIITNSVNSEKLKIISYDSKVLNIDEVDEKSIFQ